MRPEIDLGTNGPFFYVAVGLLCLAILFTASYMLTAHQPRRRPEQEKPAPPRPRLKKKDFRVSPTELPQDDQVSVYTKCPKCSLGVKVPRKLIRTKIKCRDCETEFVA